MFRFLSESSFFDSYLAIWNKLKREQVLKGQCINMALSKFTMKFFLKKSYSKLVSNLLSKKKFDFVQSSLIQKFFPFHLLHLRNSMYETLPITALRKKWYFVSKFVLTYCEKKLLKWLRKTIEIQSWRFLEVCQT